MIASRRVNRLSEEGNREISSVMADTGEKRRERDGREREAMIGKGGIGMQGSVTATCLTNYQLVTNCNHSMSLSPSA